jgi:quercetin dioxygenase-like cupin family protein
MDYVFPLTIENGHGEKLTFVELVHEPDGDKLIVEGVCQPKSGPPMHVHYKQEEGFTVIKGRIGYQELGGEEKFLEEGDSVVFKRGTAHKFWGASEEPVLMRGWVKPANSIIFFLSSMYEAQKKSPTPRPEAYDAAFLMKRYKSEYGMIGLPGIVKNVIMPFTYQVGRLTGKYKKFKEAPEPLK